MVTRYGLILLTCLFVLGACNGKQQEKDSQLALMKTTNPTPLMTDKTKNSDKVKEIKEVVSTFPELYDIAVVKGKKDTLVAYKVKHLHRFKMKKIEKRVTKRLNEKFPKEEFTVSSDYKIFLETLRLDEKMHSKKFSRHEAEKRFKEIVKMTEDIK
ncbi:hypothetical protein BABA_12221 [Neobacillus bataviensis LMG 21833]|uniref:Sporulation protein n=1 Tax=Neobacillus bataviensis LMG 21833 TaxID=1117379 RepID=K6D8F3_9BACI|nr:YhcN/YlaJ family sporulation lipoprotein [Neobacillus bataviensis]EKN68817.1 hypothetical protein BABA_12221 [Neobacillus bataviensis LMG 21833]